MITETETEIVTHPRSQRRQEVADSSSSIAVAGDLLPAQEETPDHAISAARRYNIPGDVVFKASEQLPDEQRGPLRWLHAFAADRNIPLNELAANLRKEDGSPYSANTLYKMLTGRHRADL